MLSAQPGTAEIRSADQRAMLHAEQHRETELAKLREHINHLLTHFDRHDIALELQRLHNAQPKEVREGYRMEIAMLSADYQAGAYDHSL